MPLSHKILCSPLIYDRISSWKKNFHSSLSSDLLFIYSEALCYITDLERKKNKSPVLTFKNANRFAQELDVVYVCENKGHSVLGYDALNKSGTN